MYASSLVYLRLHRTDPQLCAIFHRFHSSGLHNHIHDSLPRAVPVPHIAWLLEDALQADQPPVHSVKRRFDLNAYS
jgi:hypothetical protein